MKIANLKIGQRLNISFGLTIAMLAVVVALGASCLQMLSKDFDRTINEHYATVSALNAARNGLDEQARHLRDALLLSEPATVAAELDKAEALGSRIAGAIAQLGAQSRGPDARQLSEPLAAPGAEFGAARARLVALARAGQNEAATALLFERLRPAQQRYFGALDQLIADQAALMKDTGARATRQASLASRAMMLLGVLGALLSMLTAWFITRGIVSPVRHAVKVARTVAAGDLGSEIEVRSSDEIGQLSAALREMHDSLVRIVTEVRSGTSTIDRASSEIAAGNHDLSVRTEQQAGALEETASSMRQLTGTVRLNADHAQLANQLVRSASQVACDGGAVVRQVVARMSAINAASLKIVDIISVIDGIAFQTNILALNAAVEAARAGEQGRGFAVVAGEVRNLAQRSAAAAREIKTLIGASVAEVDAGARLVDQAGHTMEQVVGSISRVSAIMGDIAASSQSQLAGIEQVNAAIIQMDQVTQQNAALVEQAAAAAAAMQERAAQLSGVVGVFKLTAKPAPGVRRRPAMVPNAVANSGAPTRAPSPLKVAHDTK